MEMHSGKQKGESTDCSMNRQKSQARPQFEYLEVLATRPSTGALWREVLGARGPRGTLARACSEPKLRYRKLAFVSNIIGNKYVSS